MSDSTRWLYFGFDLLFVATVLFLVLRAFNSRQDISYLSLIGLCLALLVITAYLTLPALHLLSQAGLILLIAGLPFSLQDRWLDILTPGAAAQPKYLHTFWIGVLAVVGALLIVGVVSDVGAKTGELPEGVPLTAVNLPVGMSASFGSQVNAKVIISAPKDKWRSLTAESLSATVDVAGQGEGTYDLPIIVRSTVDTVKIIRVNPKTVAVRVEPVIKKTVTIGAKFSGKAGNELVPDEPIFTPNKVEASGPKSVMTDLTQASIQVKLNGETQKIEQKFTLVALTSSGEVIGSVAFEPTETTAVINLVKAGNQKTVGIRPVVTGQPSSGWWVKSLTLDPPVATVTGPVDQLSNLQEVVTEPVSVAGLSDDTTLTTTLALPSGITLASGDSVVKVKVALDEVATTKTVHPELQYDGLNSSLKVTATDPSSVAVLVSGASNLLNATADSAFKLKINLSPYQSAGTYSLTIKTTDFTLPAGAGLVSFLPSAISVTLENK